jgi:ubiquinone/menaquinone biosynthesis C-methylase UbiE
MIEGREQVRSAYRDAGVAKGYIDARFTEPIGALLHARQAAALRRTLRRLQPQRVLEIAPGPARLTLSATPWLTSAGVLCDTSREMLEAARSRLAADRDHWHFVLADAFALPFMEGFDLVYSFRLIRHFAAGDRLRLYNQIRGVLRPGGTLLFDAVNSVMAGPMRTKHPEGYCHYDALVTEDELRDEIGRAGFVLDALDGVQHRYRVLHRFQTFVAPRSRRLARMLMEVVDRAGGQPLEWVVSCHRE